MLENITFLTENQQTKNLVQEFILNWENTSDFILTFTSGSTGVPKEIRLQKTFMRTSALASGRFFGFQKGQTIRLALSPSTIGGKMLLLRGLLYDMNVEVVDASRHPLEIITQPIDFISLVPYQLEQIIENSPHQLESVNVILLGGAPVSKTLEEKIKTIPCAVFLSYGMTETMSHVALRDLKTFTFFQAIENVSFTTNENNQLIIDAPLLGVNHLLTNDVVELLSSSSFVWKGRADFVINSAGVKIHPEMIENKLSSVIKERFFICGEPDELFGERVVLIVESLVENLTLDMTSVLTKYEIPKRIYTISSFIETTSGKVNRIATKQQIDAAKTN